MHRLSFVHRVLGFTLWNSLVRLSSGVPCFFGGVGGWGILSEECLIFLASNFWTQFYKSDHFLDSAYPLNRYQIHYTGVKVKFLRHKRCWCGGQVV